MDKVKTAEIDEILIKKLKKQKQKAQNENTIIQK